MSKNFYRELKLSVPCQWVPRAKRFPSFLGMRADAPEQLDRLRVMVIGCGGVGRNISLHLARLQVGALWLTDGKRYKEESLLTQAILPAEIGQPKALATARLCKRISPHTRVHYVCDTIQSVGLGELAQADLVVVAADNIATVVEVGLACSRLAIVLVAAAVHSETLVAQTRVYSNRTPEEPCVLCQLTAAERAALNQQIRYSCDGTAEHGHQPTRSVSSLCSLAADLAINQILKNVLGLGRPSYNQMIEYCGFNNATVVSPLTRRAACNGEHQILRRVRTGQPLQTLTVMQVLRLARVNGNTSSLMLDELDWVQMASCACASPQAVNRFVRRDVTVVGRCPRCRQHLQRGSFYSHAAPPVDMLRPYARVPLASLGATSPRWLVVRNKEGGVWLSTKKEES